MGRGYTVTVVALGLSAQSPEHRTSAYLQKNPYIQFRNLRVIPCVFSARFALLNDLISFRVFPPASTKLSKIVWLRALWHCASFLRVQQDTFNLRTIPNDLQRSFRMARYNWEVENQRYMKPWKTKVALQFCSTRASKS